jgi:hypothetical protein
MFARYCFLETISNTRKLLNCSSVQPGGLVEKSKKKSEAGGSKPREPIPGAHCSEPAGASPHDRE